MGTADLVVENTTTLEELALRAFVGGIVCLCLILLAAHILPLQKNIRLLFVMLAVGIVTTVTGVLYGTAWSYQSEVHSSSEVRVVRD